MERKMSERRNRIEQLCKGQPSRAHQLNYLESNQVVISYGNNFLHCPVAKAASTFWFRFLHTLNISGPMESPFSVPISDVTDTATTSLNSLRHSDDRASFVTSAFRNVFVRNPYSRMLSAYVDKAFAPNPIFWKFWGQKAIQAFRKNASAKSLRCGHDVTFAEVVSYATRRLYKSDVHFRPMFQFCKPCGFLYNFVGKMETFARDVVHLAQTLNLSVVPYLESPQFRLDYVKDAIEDSIYSPFSWMKEILECMSKYEAGRRIWRKLQIRGLISRRIRFPFTEKGFDRVTSDRMIQLAMYAHMKSKDREELAAQKREAFVEAYRSVNITYLQKWAKILEDDFVMFGYESHPPDIFDDSDDDFPKGAFDWQLEW